jgi:hypothetical protein
MDEYYIYQNTHRKRARIHLGRCARCDRGRWQPTDSKTPGIWLGPYDRKEAFEVVMRLTSDGIDTQPCTKCEPP